MMGPGVNLWALGYVNFTYHPTPPPPPPTQTQISFLAISVLIRFFSYFFFNIIMTKQLTELK